MVFEIVLFLLPFDFYIVSNFFTFPIINLVLVSGVSFGIKYTLGSKVSL